MKSILDELESAKDYVTHKGSIINFSSSIYALCKWLILAGLLGIVIGTIASGFLYLIRTVTEYRLEHMWMMFFLPFAGVLIVFLYHITDKDNDTGTNQVLSAIRADKRVSLRLAPLILVSTVITHAFGGSVGREGAALQFGGSIGNYVGERLHLKKGSNKIFIMAGMAGAFSALFGAPFGAAVFAIEVTSVGIMHYAALVPCIFTAYVANAVAIYFGMQKRLMAYPVNLVPMFYSFNAFKAIIIGVITAIVGIFFIIALRQTHHLYSHFFKNKYLRAFVGGVLVCALSYLLGTQDYIGLGENVIDSCFFTNRNWYDFLLKILFTALTLEAGFKGGEIVPSLFIGATLGSFIAPFLTLPAELTAACGMVGLFCAVTNAPIATMLLAIELFGHNGMEYFTVVIAVSYLVSGYFSLYDAQKIAFSKFGLSEHKR